MAMSRVSTTQMYENIKSHVAKAQEQQAKTAEQASTQKALIKPSQDPSGWLQVSSLKDDNSARKTMAKNAVIANQVLSSTETIFEHVNESLLRAYDLAVAQADDARGTSETRGFVYEEVKQIFDGLIQMLNFRFGQRTLLAGFKSSGLAFDEKGNFVGDTGRIEVEIDKGLKIPLSINAQEAILGAGKENATNILANLHEFMDGLIENDPTKIRGTLEGFKSSIAQVSAVRAEIGARMNGIERALSKHAASEIDTTDTISKIEDVDAVKVLSDLARDQTILQASVATSQKILSEQPIDIFFK